MKTCLEDQRRDGEVFICNVKTTMEKFTWETEFITAANLMRHKFSDRVSVYTDLGDGLIRICKDGAAVNTIDGSEMTITEYEKLLVQTAEEAETLKNLNRADTTD